MVLPAIAPQWKLDKNIGQDLGSVLSVASNGTLIYAGNQTSLTSWDISTLEQVDSVDLQSQVRSINILGQSLFALLSASGQIAKFSLSPLAKAGTCGKNANGYCLDDKSIYVITGESAIYVYDQATLQNTGVLNMHLPSMMSIAYAAGIIAVISNDGKHTSTSFCDASTGGIRKTTQNTFPATQLATTSKGDFLVFTDQPVEEMNLFQVWNAENGDMQTTVTVTPFGPVNDILETSEGIFVAGKGIGILRNKLTLEQIEELETNNPYSLTLVNPTTLASGGGNGISVWTKSSEGVVVANPHRLAELTWKKMQSIPLSQAPSFFARNKRTIYAAVGNQLTGYHLINDELVPGTPSTLNGQVVAMIHCNGSLFYATNGTGGNGPYQLIPLIGTGPAPQGVFTSDFPINCATASASKIYLGCAQGVVYIVDPVALTGLKIGTNKSGITAIAVTPKALAITAGGHLSSYDPENGTAFNSGDTDYQVPMLVAAGDDYIVTAESAPEISNPFGLKIFPLKAPKAPSLPVQTQMQVNLPIFDALLFEDQMLTGGVNIQSFSNDINLKPLGTLENSTISYSMIKIDEDLFVSYSGSALELWGRGPVTRAHPSAQESTSIFASIKRAIWS